jgi:DNA-binding beta-propeller fold protein YncE
MKQHRLILTLALSLLFAPLAHPGNAFLVKKKFTLGGEGGWDYLTYDRDNHRLFITRGTHVIVVDPASGQQLADIPNTPGVHGVALVPEVSKGFISAGRANQVVVFDLKSLKETARIAVGEGPDAIAYEPVSHRVFTFNARSQDTTSIDTRTDKVVGTIPLQGKPEFAVANGDGQLFVNIESSGEIAELDPAGLKVLHRWPMKGCEEPTGLALDKADSVLLSGCSNKTLAVVNAKDGTLVTTLPIGASVDGVSFDPELRLGFSSNGEGTLTVIGQENGKWQVLQNVTTQRGARTLTLNPASHEIYVVTAAIVPEQERPSYVPNTFTLLVVGQ